MGEEQFKNAENEYFRIKGLLATGRMSKEEFEQSLRRLTILDAQGRNWILGVDDGKWYAQDGKSWIQADPYRVATSTSFAIMPGAIPAAPEKSNALKYVAIALGGVILLCLGVGAGVLLASSLGLVPLIPLGVKNAPTPFPSPLVFTIATVPPIPTGTPLATFTALPTPTVTPTATPSPTLTITPRPEGNCADPNARWENVVDGQTLESYQAFIGTANADNFEQYVVEWLRPGNVLHRSATPVIHGSLFVWNTFTVANGEYPVALIVVLKDGTTLAPCVVRVLVLH